MVDGSMGAVRLEVADAVATITLDRPEARNALDAAAKRDLLAALRSVGRDRALRAVILTGAGAAFCAGQDLRETQAPDAPALSVVLRETYHPLIVALRGLDKPVLAAVNGVAAGAGMALALACDLRIAADTATFVLAFGRVGLVPDSGSTWFLPRLVGPARAAELALLGEPLSAEVAERWGLVNRVVAAGSLADEAHAMAKRLAAGPPVALGLAKRLLNRSLDATLDGQLEDEADAQGVAGRTQDHREGVAAFLAKRPPRFTGS